jgi:tRNA 2-thiouridine synthesizing protein E
MPSLMDEIVGAGNAPPDPRFPHAPAGWSEAAGAEAARRERLEPGAEHWEAVRAPQEYYAKHEGPGVNMRELHDALDEKFHARGGIRHLYGLFPGGPIAQGCRIAGLKAPAGATDRGFGSVA